MALSCCSEHSLLDKSTVKSGAKNTFTLHPCEETNTAANIWRKLASFHDLGLESF